MRAQQIHNTEAEKDIVAVLMNTRRQEVISGIFLELDAKDFYSIETQVIFEACRKLWQSKKAITFTTVIEVLEKAEQMNAAGGISALSEIYGRYISDGGYTDTVAIVKNNANGRQAVRIAEELTAEAAKNPKAAIDNAIKKLSEIGQAQTRELDSIQEAMNETERRIKNNTNRDGATTPFRTLNGFLRQMATGDTVIIAARPSVGKSAFLLEIILHNAKRGKKTALFSLEMSKDEIARRIYSRLLGVPTHRLHKTPATEIAAAKDKLRQCNLYLSDNIFDIDAICRACRVQKQRAGLDLVCIDYLQLITTSERKERRLQIEDISRALKLLAVDLDISVVILSQMNRSVEYQNRPPQLSDLRESGAIEQDASQVIFLAPSKAKADKLKWNDDKFIEVYIEKNRNGKVGLCFLRFCPDRMTFEEIDKDGKTIPTKLEDLEQIEIDTDIFEE